MPAAEDANWSWWRWVRPSAAVVDVLRGEGIKVGLVKVLFPSVPGEALRQALGHAGAVAVLDRAISLGFQGVLATEVKAAYDAPRISALSYWA
jgi:pyruvate ferredoxin oxidoreductase alpha subunit